jgi:hypothetical protein
VQRLNRVTFDHMLEAAKAFDGENFWGCFFYTSYQGGVAEKDMFRDSVLSFHVANSHVAHLLDPMKGSEQQIQDRKVNSFLNTYLNYFLRRESPYIHAADHNRVDIEPLIKCVSVLQVDNLYRARTETKNFLTELDDATQLMQRKLNTTAAVQAQEAERKDKMMQASRERFESNKERKRNQQGASELMDAEQERRIREREEAEAASSTGNGMIERKNSNKFLN